MVSYNMTELSSITADAVAAGDFTGDGKPDVVTSAALNIRVFPGDGAGSFGLPILSSGVAPSKLRVADIDGDGKLDLYGKWAAVSVRVLFGNGDGTFTSTTDAGSGLGVEADFAAADFNGDGRTDIAVSDRFGDRVSIFFQGPGRTLTAGPVISGVSQPFGLHAGDVTGDGRSDLVVARTANTLLLLTGDGSGGFSSSTVATGVGTGLGGVTANDYDGDGIVDLAYVSFGGRVGVLRGSGGGTFVAAQTLDLPSPAGFSLINGQATVDGRPDLIVNPATDTAGVHILSGRGDGTFDLASFSENTDSRWPGGSDRAAADFNGDGLTDIVTRGTNPRVIFARPFAFRGAQFSSYRVTNGVVATFHDNLAPNSTAADYSAVINWGSGRSTPGQIEASLDGGFRVIGSHDYPDSTDYQYTVTVTRVDGRSVVVTGWAIVRDAPPFKSFGYPFGTSVKMVQFAPGPGQTLWFSGGAPSGDGSLGLVDAAAVSASTLPGTPVAGQGQLVSDAAGNAWVVYAASVIGRSSPSGTSSTFPVVRAGTALAIDPGGDAWFVSRNVAGTGVDRLGRVNAADGTVSYITLSTVTPIISQMILGPDGNFWATHPDASRISRISAAGVVTTFTLPNAGTLTNPGAIIVGADGNLWVAIQSSNRIARVTPAGNITYFPVGADPVSIAAAPDGDIWYAGYNTGRIGRMTLDGKWFEYPTWKAQLDIQPDALGNVWVGHDLAAGRLNVSEATRLAVIPTGQLRKNIAFNGEIARITDPTLGAPEDYNVQINWGNGSTTAGTLTPTADGYSVTTAYTYQQEGNFRVTVTVSPWADTPVLSSFDVAVDDPLEVVQTWQAFATERIASESAVLLTFRDTDPDGKYGPFTATVDWGNGTSNATVVATATPGVFNVIGSRNYTDEGVYAVSVTVRDAAASVLTVSTTARVAKAFTTLPPASYDATSAGALAVGDFNGDGLRDVASASSASGIVEVLRGLGGGLLPQGQPAVSTGGQGVRALAAADFNRDGRADLAVASGVAGSGRIDIHYGMADGTFTPGPQYFSAAGALAVGDLNADGRPDLISVAGESSSLGVMLGDGFGGFAASQLPLAAAVSALAVADFDRDGRDDIALGVSGTLGVRVFRSRGDGSFDAPTEISGVAAAEPRLTAGDITGDGKPDIALADGVSNTLVLLTGDGVGGFASAALPLDEAITTGASGPAVGTMIAADVNADGVSDLVRGVVSGTPHLNIRLGQGLAVQRPLSSDLRRPLASASLTPASAVVAADLNGDNRVDLVTAVGGKVTVLMNTPYSVASSTVSMTEGFNSTRMLATITHENTPTSAIGWSASIDWGDGTSSPATLTANSTGGLNIDGTKAYRRAGSYVVTIIATDPTGLRIVISTTASVSNAGILVTPQNFSAVTNVPVTAMVARFRDLNGSFTQLSDFSATIDWGNGRVTPGIVRADPASGSGEYTVTGTQTYVAPASATVRVTITDAAAPTTNYTGTATATVTSPAFGGGSISGTVRNDINFDGVADAGEPPLLGWRAYVDQNNNAVYDAATEASALSSSAGTFTIADLAGGDYVVRLVPAAGWRQTDPASTSGRAIAVTTGIGATGADFLLTRRPAAILLVGQPVRTSSLEQAGITFSEPVSGFDIADLTLTRDGVEVPLTSASLQTTDSTVFTLGSLSNATATAGSYALQLRGAGSGIQAVTGDELAVSLTAGFTVETPPAVETIAFNGGGTQRSRVTSIVVKFNGPVAFTAAPFLLTRRDGASTGVTIAAANPAGDNRTWVLTFSGSSLVGGSLADGIYDLRVSAAAVRSTVGAGTAMAADHVFAFHRLFSDADGDGDSDNADLFAMRATNNRTTGDPAFNAAFDGDGDGDVDNADIFQVRNRRTITYKGY